MRDWIQIGGPIRTLQESDTARQAPLRLPEREMHASYKQSFGRSSVPGSMLR